jgi:multidrug efflux pump subunit AcrA (membrane-fusion protein)
MKRICLRSAILAFIAAMLLTGCGKKEEAAPPPLPPTPPAPPVVQVTKAVEEENEAPGFQAIAILEGSTNTEIHARVTGYLIRQDYREGASVGQGDLLFEMDARPFQAALDQAKASLADKQGRSAAQADIDAAQASVAAAQSDLAATKIAAPVGGIAGRAVSGLGDWIAPGTPLTTISTVDPIKAVFTLPKKFYLDHADRIAQALALPPEARPETLELVLADGTPYSHKGKWDSMGRPASASSGPVACALFSNPDRVLRPGQYVKVGEGKP